MTIEIHSPNLRVSEKTIGAIEKKILELSHFGEKVSRAEVFLSEDMALSKDNKQCKIRLSIFGDDLFVHKNANNFQAAAFATIKVLKRNLKKKQEQHNQVPEEITTTVDV